MLLDAAADPSTRFVLIARPVRDRRIPELVSWVKRFNIASPISLSLEVRALPLMLEEEALVSEQARNDFRGDSNVSDVLDGRVSSESPSIGGNVLRHHAEEFSVWSDLLQLVVERYLLTIHKLASIRPPRLKFLAWLEPEVEWEVDSGVHLLPIGFPASKFRET